MQSIKKYTWFMILTTLLALSLTSGFADAKTNQANDLNIYNQYDPFAILQELSDLVGQGGFPRVDIRETQNEFIIDADVPGVDLDSLSVTIENDVLTIAGKEIAQDDLDGAVYHKQERFNGDFVRKIQLPRAIDEDAIRATNNNGVLRITISKKALSQARNIAIENNQ
jgi:HSP20 family protein